MRTLRYCINVTLDGCVDHEVGTATEDTHRFHAESLAKADAFLFGRITYEMMEAGWRHPDPNRPDWAEPFAEVINAGKKYVVSSTLDAVDWNAEILRGDLRTEVERLKAGPGTEILTGGVTLPLALTEMGLVDEFEFVVMPRVAGRGPSLLAGVSHFVDLELIDTKQLESGAVALRYRLR